MSVSVKRFLNSPLMVGACITAVVTVAGTVYALFHPRSPQAIANAEPPLQATATDCKIVVFDPNAPLNVRSEPVEQAGNIVGNLPNGEALSVIGRANGWLKINAPIAGWVYQNLTKESCGGTPVAVLTPKPPLPDARLAPPNDEGTRLYAEAESHFHKGNLPGAIALARLVSKDSAAYEKAQAALKTMPKTWKQAQAKYHTAKQAEKANHWNEVLVIAKDFPDIRFWREQLAPIVRQAIQRKYNSSTNEIQ